MVFQDPRPAEEELSKCYTSYHTHQTEELPDSFIQEWSGVTRWIRGGILRSKYGYKHFDVSRSEILFSRLLDFVPYVRNRARCGLGVGRGSGLPHFRGSGQALDIGTGAGVYAATLKRLGWNVTGVEFDASAAHVASERMKLNIYVGSLEDAEFGAESFDFVSMFHVIEHLPDPLSTLKECFRVMNNRAKIIIRTPNFNSLTRRVYGKFWRGVEAPRHLFLFSPDTLVKMLERAGFHVTSITTTKGAARFYVQASQKILERESHHSGKSVLNSLRTGALVLAARVGYLLRIKIGDELHIEAVKAD